MGHNRPGNLSPGRSDILRPRYIHHHLRRDDHLPTDPPPLTIEYQTGAKGRCRVSLPPGSFHDRLLDPAIDPDSPSGLRRRKLHDAGSVGNY